MTTITSSQTKDIKKENNDMKKAQESYNNFIKQIQINDIKLTASKIENSDCNYFPKSAEISWKDTAKFEMEGKKFIIFHRYDVRVKDTPTKEIKAKVSVTFCVSYESKISMTEELFEPFKVRNLPINTWPYFREYVHDVLGRMGWPPFIMPVYVPQQKK